MTERAHWMPERWREALANLRDDIYDIAERWLPRSHGTTTHTNGHVPVRSQERTAAADRFWSPSRWRASQPSIDIDETPDEVLVTADLPGLQAEDFTVEISGERLMIRGEQKHESHHSERGYRYQERHHGVFARVLHLPCEVDADKAQATYNRGVLRVTLPKTERSKAKQIHIQAQE
jgi:HSP20 family protein